MVGSEFLQPPLGHDELLNKPAFLLPYFPGSFRGKVLIPPTSGRSLAHRTDSR